MKKILTTICLVFATLVLFAEVSGTCGPNLKWTLDDNGTLTISGTGEMDDYDFGSMYSYVGNGAKWYNWYTYKERIYSVIIESGVTGIANGIFYGCNNLTSIQVDMSNPIYDSRNNCNAIIETATNTLIAGCQNTIIPNSVTSLGYGAFSDGGLTSIEIPQSIRYIAGMAFYGCRNLTTIDIPNNVLRIGERAFGACNNLISIEIPNSVTSIGNSAFSGCRSLTSIEIPNSVTSIESYVFSSCSSLTSIEIPNSVTSIGIGAFQSCSSLTSIEIPNSVTSIKSDAFISCSSLISIEIPNSITSIEFKTFAGCRNLTSIEIPNSVTSIGSYAFQSCSSLTYIEIPSRVKKIDREAFYNCSNLKKVKCLAKNPSQIDKSAFESVNTWNIPLYVPAESVEAYKAADVWKDFDIRAIGSEVFFTVQFIGYNGADLGSQEVEAGEAAITPDPQTPEGYKFIGWNLDFSNVQSDMTVKAQYGKIFIGHHGDTEYEYIIRDNCE